MTSLYASVLQFGMQKGCKVVLAAEHLRVESAFTGYHVYKEVWDVAEEELLCRRETGNPNDLYAVSVYQ